MYPKRFAQQVQRRLWFLESENRYRTGPDAWQQCRLSVAAAWDEGEDYYVVIRIDAGPRHGFVGYTGSMSSEVRQGQADLEDALATVITRDMYGDYMVQYLDLNSPEQIHWRYCGCEAELPHSVDEIPACNSWTGTLECDCSDLSGHLAEQFLQIMRRSLNTKFLHVLSLSETVAEVEGRVGGHFGSIKPFANEKTFALRISFTPEQLISELLSNPLGFFDLWGPEQRSITWAAVNRDRAEWELEGALNILLGRVHSELFVFYQNNKQYVDDYFRSPSRKMLASTSLTSFSAPIELQLPNCQ